MTIQDIILSFICSFFASFIFWLLSVYLTETKIQFADFIEKSINVYANSGTHRYRLKVINIGYREFLEVNYIVKLSIKRLHTANTTYLAFGYSNSNPVLHGRRWQKKNKNLNATWTGQLTMTEASYKEFAKNIYATNIRNAARKKTLTLTDILNTYKDKVNIQVYAFGYDGVTGARKMFLSKTYTYTDVLEGKYNVGDGKYFKKYKTFVSYILSIKTKSNTKTI